MNEILYCFDVGEKPPEVKESLIRSNLGSLLQGLRLGHIDRVKAALFLNNVKKKWKNEIESYPPSTPLASCISIVKAFNLLVSEYRENMDLYKFSHSKCLIPRADEFIREKPICKIMRFETLKFWLNKDIDFHGKSLETELDFDEESHVRLAEIMELCSLENNLIELAEVGFENNPIWLTPFHNEIFNIINSAESMNKEFGAENFHTYEFAVNAKDHLGLLEYSNVTIFAVVFDKNLNLLLEDTERTTRTPTVFDASGFQRFRHWPTKGRERSDNDCFGRTYELNSDKRNADAPNDGCEEFITTPIPLKEINKFVYLGKSTVTPDGNLLKELTEEYAEDICFRETLSDILDELEAYI